MKPHIVTEDMRLRARDGQELEGKHLPRDGVVSPAGGPGQRLRPPDLQHLPGPGRRDHVQLLRLLWGGACRPGTGLLLCCAGAELLLLGWSEGTMIAPAVAAGGAVPLAGLLLAGYANGTMEEALDWQQRGLGLYTMLCQYFDADGDGSISREEFETGPGAVREALEATFSGLDLDGDGRITPADLEAVYAGSRAEIFRAIEAGDDEWLWEHYPVPLTTNWFRGPPEVSTGRPCPVWTCPSISSRGGGDANTPAEDALAIQETFRRLGKDNLAVHIYPDAGHALGFEQYLATGNCPPRPHRSL